MIYLLTAILLSTFVITFFKVLHLLKLNEEQTITYNYLFASAWGWLVWQEPLNVELLTGKTWFWPAVVVGFFFIAGFVLFARSSARAGLAITAVSGKMSVVIPVLAGFLIFHESVKPVQVTGILLALLSFYLIFKPEGKLRPPWKLMLLPLMLFFTSGTNDTFVKYIEYHYLDGDIHLFLFVVFLVAFVLGVFRLLPGFFSGKFRFQPSALLGGFVLGSLNFWSAWFFIKSMMLYPASFLFPVVNVSVVSLSALTGLLLFGEKMNRINWAGILLAIFAILLISTG